MLDAFTADHLRKPWQPGSVDCLLALADWTVACGYPDPVAHLRGAYDSEDGFQAIIAAHGGVVPLVGDCCSRIGLTRADRPAIGSVGVIGSWTDIQRQFGAIFDGKGWRVRFKDAYPRLSARPLQIWKV